MRIKFWGVRGSIPSPLTNEQLHDKLISLLKIIQEKEISDEDAIRKYLKKLPFPTANTYGGNTSCVEVRAGETRFILDAGTGIRHLGYELMKHEFAKGEGEVYLYLSHTHWDHVQGIPFFIPLYIPGNKVSLFSAMPDLLKRLKLQQNDFYFPVKLRDFKADFTLTQIYPEKTYDIGGISVRCFENHHPGKSFALCMEAEGKKLIYCTDAEFNHQSTEYVNKAVEFFKDADLLIFDAQYEADESFHKVDYGHSSAAKGIDIAFKSNVKKLAFFHAEPAYDDDHIFDLYIRAINYKHLLKEADQLEVIQSYEGLEIEI